MKIENERSYDENADLKAGKELAKKYMKQARAEVPHVIGNGLRSSTKKSAAQIVQKFFHEDYIETVYLYEENGGWYSGVMCKRDDETYTFGNFIEEPHGTEQEAIEYIIASMAKVIAFGQGKLTLVDNSEAPEGCIDFRLYDVHFCIKQTALREAEQTIELKKMLFDTSVEDSCNVAAAVIHAFMSMPNHLRDNELIEMAMLELIINDVYAVDCPVGWDGDPFEMPVSV